MEINIEDVLQKHMKKSGAFVAARLQAALALLERLREHPRLDLAAHKTPNSAGLISHESYGKHAHKRLGLQTINSNHGRRSNNIGDWGPILLERLESAGFTTATDELRSSMIDSKQRRIADCIQKILFADPITVRIGSQSAPSVIADVLRQAEAIGKPGEVAQYLVGAKLEIRLGRELEVVPANKRDRKSRRDLDARSGDFEIEHSTIEVALGPPDKKHLRQVEDALERSEQQVWLLTRFDRVDAWYRDLNEIGADMRRVVVSSVESFVGQNATEMGEFSSKKTRVQLQRLFNVYNERWIQQVGSPGMKIAIKS